MTPVPARQSGFLTITVLVILSALAVIALSLSFNAASRSTLLITQASSNELSYVLESAIEHASWQLAQNGTCLAYENIGSTNFGQHSYSASVTPGFGSPVSIAAVGTLADGTSKSLTRDRQRVYQQPSNLILQPGVDGIDASLFGGPQRNSNFGSSSVLNIKSDRNVLIAFNLSSLPAGAIVTDAKLSLYMEWANSISTEVIDVHTVARDWVEGTYNDVNPPTGGGATYEEHDGGNNWSNSGGDYNTSIIDSVTISSSAAAWHEWTVTDAVQAWAAGATNNGMLLREGAGSTGNSQLEFTSSDGAAARRPKLTVTYKCECGSTCATPPGTTGSLLLVVADSDNLLADEALRKALVEAWGYSVELIDDAATQAQFDTAAAANDVVYVAQESVNAQLADKLRLLPVGVVNEEEQQFDELGLSSAYDADFSQSDIEIVDGIHDITAGYSLGDLQITASAQPMQSLQGTVSPDLVTLAEHPTSAIPILAVLDAGASLFGGGSAAGRRVWLPWGGSAFQFSSLNADGQTILQRSIEWAAASVEVPTTVPVAHWKFDDGAGSDAIDSVGGHTGTLVNGPAWTDTGHIDGALQFDGSNDLVAVPHADSLAISSAITMSAWIKNDTGMSGSYRILSKETSGSNDSYWLSVQGANLWMGIDGSFFSPGDSLASDTWTHVAATFDSDAGEVRMYINGVESLVQSTTAVLAGNTAPLTIGSNWEGKDWSGSLDDVRIYAQALSPAEIAELYAISSPGGGSGGSDKDQTYKDEFNEKGSFAGDDGTLSWSADWIEIGESDGGGSGDIRVTEDLSEFQLRIRDNDNGGEGVEREADLSTCSEAQFSYYYRRDGLDNANDFVAVSVSGDGGKNWQELERLQGNATDSQYVLLSHDISKSAASDTLIRFLGSPGLGGSDAIYIDDVEITCK